MVWLKPLHKGVSISGRSGGRGRNAHVKGKASAKDGGKHGVVLLEQSAVGFLLAFVTRAGGGGGRRRRRRGKGGPVGRERLACRGCCRETAGRVVSRGVN